MKGAIKINLNEIIDAIPNILIYYIPGYIAVKFYKLVTRTKASDNHTILSSCALSYFTILIIRAIEHASGFNFSIFAESIAAIIICFFFIWLWIQVLQKPEFRSFLIRHFSFSFAPTAWDDVFDYQVGTAIRVKYRNSNKAIVGIVSSIGELPSDPWIALSYYWVYPDIRESNISYEEDRPGHYMMINLNDIEFAEVWSNKKEEPA